MEGKIQTIKFLEDFRENNVYEVSLDNGTSAKAYLKKDAYKDKQFASGEAIGTTMHYEMSPKGNFSKIQIGDTFERGYEKQNGTPSQGFAPKSYGGSDSRQTSIVRQSCLNRATDLVAAGKADIKDVIGMAERFEDWVNRVEASKPEPQANHLPRTEAKSDELPPIEKYEEAATDGLPF